MTGDYFPNFIGAGAELHLRPLLLLGKSGLPNINSLVVTREQDSHSTVPPLCDMVAQQGRRIWRNRITTHDISLLASILSEIGELVACRGF